MTKTNFATLAGTVVKNDGNGLKDLMVLKTLKHTGNFVFAAETADGQILTISTEPTDDGNIEITSIK